MTQGTRKSPLMEGLKAGWKEFFVPPEHFKRDLITAVIVGVCLFGLSSGINALALPGLAVPSFISAASGAMFVLNFNYLNGVWKSAADAFSNAYEATKAQNEGVVPSLEPSLGRQQSQAQIQAKVSMQDTQRDPDAPSTHVHEIADILSPTQEQHVSR